MEPQQQTVLITGGASGMGRATAERFLKAGARVIIFDRQIPAWLNAFPKQQIAAFQVDVTDEATVITALTKAIELMGVPRVCIQCAGVAPAMRLVGKTGPAPLEHFQEVIAINLIGTINVMRLVAQKMMQLDPIGDTNERGVFILTASVAAFEGQLGQAAYSASKGGVVGLTLPAAREFAQFGIRVMTIAPGLVDTPMFHGLSPEARQSLTAAIPFPKTLANPSQYADLALHIVENSYLNGSVIRLDAALRMG